MIKIYPNKVLENMYVKSKKKIIKKILIFICIVLILFVTLLCLLKNILYPLAYFDIVEKEAAKNNIDPYLVLAVIKTESNFKKYAVSNKSAKGLMQIMDSTAQDIKNKMNEEIDANDIYNEHVNISLGCKYFSTLINKYNGNYYLAICAYNAGMGNVDKWIEEGIISNSLSEYKNVNIPFSQTKDYLYKVINSYKIYRILYE